MAFGDGFRSEEVFVCHAGSLKGDSRKVAAIY